MCVAPRYKNYPEAIDTGVVWSYPIFGDDQEVCGSTSAIVAE
jgi:hypothetical protein